MAQSGEYEYIVLNRSWKVSTGLKGAAGNLRPDIIGASTGMELSTPSR